MKRHRGSALVTTLVLGTVLATVTGSYLATAVNAMNLSDRTFNGNAAVSLAEAGVEAGLWAYNRGDWAAWTSFGGGDNKRTTLSAFKAAVAGGAAALVDLDRGTQGEATIAVYALSSATPRIVARAQVWNNRNPDKTRVERWVEADLKKRSYFATGLVGRDAVTFNGNNASVDAYDSRLGDYAATLPDGTANRYAKGTVGTLAITSAVYVNNADIWGSVAVGSSSLEDIDLGPQGSIGPFGTARGTKDPESVSTDFRAEMPDVVAPATAGSTTVAPDASIELTGSTDPEHPVVYSAADVSISGGSHELAVTGHVVLVCSTLSITGGATQLTVAGNSSLKIYCAGDLTIAGNGIVNPTNTPQAVQIYGTAANGMAQTIAIKGNGSLAGVVYAPNAAVTINGNGAAYGSFVGRTITVSGNADFHYDLALGDLTTGQPAKVNLWRELLDPAAWPVADFQ